MIKDFNHQYVRREDRMIFGLSALLIVVGLALILINTLFTHYPGHFYLPKTWLFVSPIILGIILVSLFAIKLSPRVALFSRTYGSYFFLFCAMAILLTGIQFTPFTTIDPLLAHIDKTMGFHTLSVLNWTFAHPTAHSILHTVYMSLFIEMLAVPLILAILKERRSIDTFFIAATLSFLLGSMVYYFFPTEGPAAIFHSPDFQHYQSAIITEFLQIHHHETLTAYASGIIAFPSFHVIWATLLTYALFKRKWLFYPAVVFNAVMISSTVFLGWHYLTDVFGGLAIGFATIYLAEKLVANNKITLQAKDSVRHKCISS